MNDNRKRQKAGVAMIKIAFKGLLIILSLYILYVVITAVVLFYVPLKTGEETTSLKPASFFGHSESTDRVRLLEDGYEAGRVRIQMIQESEKSIDIAYYSIGKGESTDLIMAALFKAADRGVHTRVLLDGIANGLRGNRRGVLYALASHPNIEVKYYEPFQLFKPWAWQNRMHDKIMIVDGRLGIIGGRNIGDKYLAKKPPLDFVYDRDVFITNSKHKQDSVITQMQNYINELWAHPYTKKTFHHLTQYQVDQGKRMKALLLQQYDKAKQVGETFATPKINWNASTVPTKRVSFIHNPIERFNKRPFMWKTFINLAEGANRSVLIQSPYVVPTNAMRKYIAMKKHPAVQWTLLTNSVTSTPNVLAFSGYISMRDTIMKTGVKLYEYQEPYSIHAKSVIYDQRLSAVGSFNLDSRSTFLNNESMVIIDSQEFAKKLTIAMENKMDKSILIANHKRWIKSPDIQKKEEPVMKRTFLYALAKVTRFFKEFI